MRYCSFWKCDIRCSVFLSSQEFLYSGNMTEAGPMGLIDDKSDYDQSPSLPGVLKGKLWTKQ